MRRVWWIGFALLLIGPLLVAVPARAQADLTGVIDIHAHSDPDSMPRSIDAIDLAKLAKQRGMRGLVLKNHYESTAALAYIVRKEVPGIEIFGGHRPESLRRRDQSRRHRADGADEGRVGQGCVDAHV